MNDRNQIGQIVVVGNGDQKSNKSKQIKKIAINKVKGKVQKDLKAKD